MSLSRPICPFQGNLASNPETIPNMQIDSPDPIQNDIDGRRVPLSRTEIRLRNEGQVYRVAKNLNSPATVAQISGAIPGITEKTVRRAIDKLCTNGYLVEAGRGEHGSTLYQTSNSVTSWDNEKSKRIRLGGNFVTVGNFLDVMTNQESHPFTSRLKQDLLTEGIMHWLRQRMLLVVMTAGEAGYSHQVESVRAGMVKVQAEMHRVVELVDNFIDSAVWYEHHRDGMAHDLRRAQEADSNLVQLAWDYIKSPTKED